MIETSNVATGTTTMTTETTIVVNAPMALKTTSV
jgi:hypothetical protein